MPRTQTIDWPRYGFTCDPRKTRAWRTLRDRVVREEPLCTLRRTGCTGLSQTADHIVPVIERPDLAMDRANLRGACVWCNGSRGSGTSATTPTRHLSFFD